MSVCGGDNWEELERHIIEQETTRKINEDARIENEKARIRTFDDTVNNMIKDIMVIESPDGTRWKLNVDNSGNLSTTRID